MLRITTSNENGVTWIRLEGKLVGPWVEACRAECERRARSGAPLRVDLSAVGFVDPPGEALLRGLMHTGAIGPTSSFVRELLRPKAPRAAEREELVRRHLPELLALARRLSTDEAQAAEAVQSAFRTVLGSGDASDPGPALRGCVIDACLARARSRSSAGSAALDPLLPRFDRSGHHATPIAPWPAHGEVALDALRSATRRALDGLPELHRVVIVLHDVEGLAAGEIARRLGSPLADVRRMLHEARQGLIGLVRPALRSSAVHALDAAKTA